MPARTPSILERAKRVYQRHLSLEDSSKPDKRADILVKLTVRQRALAHVAAKLRGYDSLQQYLVSLIEGDIREAVPASIQRSLNP